MTGDGEQIDAERFHIGFDFSDRLSGICVTQHTVLVCDPGDLRDGLNGSHLVVGVHHGNQRGRRSNRVPDVVGIDQPKPVDGEPGNFSAQPLDKPTWFQNGGMFDPADDDVKRPSGSPSREEQPFDGMVIGFRAP